MEGIVLGNRYELIEKIGGGGMAVVYKARCTLLNRFVAVKILRPEFSSDREFLNRFKIESQAAASLSHPNIVSIYDEGNEGNIYYIVMEYVNGKTLKEYIQENGVLPSKTALNIAIQICSALEHAHKNNIVHRDIKPHNIIITNEMVAKVADFGIARAVSSSTLSLSGDALGSVHYFSPEQARGGYTDEKSDIYSLGIVLYEMLTGKLPFDGETPVSVAIKHLEDEITPPIKIIDSIPTSLNAIILKATQKNQANRYQSAGEMLKDLNSALKIPDGDFVNINYDLDQQPTQRVSIGNEMRNIRNNKKDDKNLDNSSETKRSDRITVIAALSTSFLIILIISALVGFFLTARLANKTIEVRAKNVVGMNIEDAKTMMSQDSITLNVVESRYDEKISKDIIISQQPEPGIAIKSPGEMQVVLSLGQESVKVPDLTGMDVKSAQYELQKYGLVFKPTFEYSPQIPQNYVIRQNPAGDVMASRNSQVEVVISNGISPEKIKVPNLIGLNKNDAKAALRGKNLLLGKTSYSEDINKPYDTVLNQSILPDTEVDNLTKVDLILNSYKAQTTTGSSNSSEIFINLTNKVDKDTYVVKVELEDSLGKRIVYNSIHNRGDTEARVPIEGKGTAQVRVYIDDKLDSEETVDLGGESQ